MSPFSAFTARRGRQLLRGAAILSATVLACSLVAPDVHATTGSCRSEPVVVLSNGYAIDMNATVSDDASDVQSVNYTVKVPSGVSVVSHVDDAILGVKDTYSVDSSNNAGNYTVGVSVNTGTKSSVSATADLVNALHAHVSSNSASGTSNQQLWMSVSG
jgi:uncharacterized NAD-dependent epimerase/dehydratase family protein